MISLEVGKIKKFEELEKEVIEGYDSLKASNPSHPLLGILTREEGTFKFNRLFDVKYQGANVRSRYELLIQDLRDASQSN